MGKHDPEVPGSHRFLLFVPRWCENLIDRPSLKYPQVSAMVPPAFAPSRNSEDLVPPGMIAPGCGSKVDELRGVCRGGDFRAA
jgi:hypothetical protein